MITSLADEVKTFLLETPRLLANATRNHITDTHQDLTYNFSTPHTFNENLMIDVHLLYNIEQHKEEYINKFLSTTIMVNTPNDYVAAKLANIVNDKIIDDVKKDYSFNSNNSAERLSFRKNVIMNTFFSTNINMSFLETIIYFNFEFELNNIVTGEDVTAFWNNKAGV